MKILRRWIRKIKRFFLAPVRAVERQQRKTHGRKTCESKRKFMWKEQAWSFALNCNRIKGMTLSPYKCQYCGHYHLTSKYKTQSPPKHLKP